MRALVLVVVLAGCSNDVPPAPKPAPAKTQEPIEQKPPADPPKPLSARTPAIARESWFMRTLSHDGKRALLRELANDHKKIRYRVIAVDTNTIETDLELPQLSTLPLETLTDDGAKRRDVNLKLPELTEELKKAAQVLEDFPTGFGDRIAASPDGKHVAFNAGDWIFVATDGVVTTQLSKEASYYPWFSPDGNALFFHRYTGTLDGVEGKYELFVTSPDGKAKPKKLANSAGLRESFVLTGTGAARFVVTNEPHVRTCAVEVSLTPPHATKKLGCLKDKEDVMSCVMSPAGKYVACRSSRELDELDPNSTTTINGKKRPNKKLAFRTRAFEADTGKVTFDGDPIGSLSAISDDGVMIILGRGDTIETFDVKGQQKTIPRQGYVSLFTLFRNAKELVIEMGGDVSVIDVTK